MDEIKPPSQGAPLGCAAVEQRLTLYTCEELGAGERAAVEQHVGQCAACAAALAQVLRLRQAFTAVEQPAEKLDPSGLLLAQCRSELAEALDDVAAREISGRWGRLRALHPLNWLARSFVGHPAWSAALLILLGVALGTVVPEWVRQQGEPGTGLPAMTVSAARLSDQDLQNMGVAGINWAPNGATGSPNVEVRLTAQKPVVLRGSLEDAEVKRVLTYVMLNGQQFDPGVRLDSVDLLRTRSSDAEIRRALCAAARKDHNAAVRLRALEALRGFEREDAVRQTLVEALVNDENPGVRVEAINLLGGMLQVVAERGQSNADEPLVNALRNRVKKEPNKYVRLQCESAIRQMGPRKTY